MTEPTPKKEHVLVIPKPAVIFGAGLALGIMLKQHSDIRMLKQTVAFMQANYRS